MESESKTNSQEKRRILLCDTTLRDGAQSPSMVLAAEEKMAVAESLVEAQIDEIEAGTPAAGTSETDFIHALKSRYPELTVSCWCRCREEDIKAARHTKADIVHISVPASPFLLTSMNMTWHATCDTLIRLISMAREHFPSVSVGIQDSFRTPPETIDEIMQIADSHCICRARFADTTGTAMPEDVSALFSRISSRHTTALGFHGHNDLGLSAANSLAAACSGAAWIDVTVNGIGERAGNTGLHIMAVILSLHRSFETAFRLQRIQAVSSLVNSLTDRRIPPNEPVTGENVFTHSSGIHCRGLIRDELSYQPFRPEYVGRERTVFVADSLSGIHGINHMLETEGIQVDKNRLKPFSDLIRKKSLYYRKGYSAAELALEYTHYSRGD